MTAAVQSVTIYLADHTVSLTLHQAFSVLINNPEKTPGGSLSRRTSASITQVRIDVSVFQNLVGCTKKERVRSFILRLPFLHLEIFNAFVFFPPPRQGSNGYHRVAKKKGPHFEYKYLERKQISEQSLFN